VPNWQVLSDTDKTPDGLLTHTDWNGVFSCENPNIGKIQILTKEACQIKAHALASKVLNSKSMNPVIFNAVE
jgi:hypothetical protein